MAKVSAAIIGSGNIGTDLMVKLRKSEVIELKAVIGIDPNSEGLARAKRFGYEVYADGLDGYLSHPESEIADMFFDATSAKAHLHHAKLLKDLGKQVLDLTPAAIGPFVSAAVNLGSHMEEINVNMITCGGQATIPMVYAVSQVCNVEYAEIVATISSKSAGPGTRANIDEFTETTALGIEKVGGAKKGKAIIVLNPAEPPIIMRDTVYCLVEAGTMDEEKITQSIKQMVSKVQEYVPGYQLKTDPIFDGDKVSIFLKVEGAGHYLPKYAGNLDIMTASAKKVAEEMAKHKLAVQA